MGLFGNLFGRKKPPVDFSNVRAGGSSTAAPPGPVPTRTGGPEWAAPPAPPAPQTMERIYVVVSGDSLSKIAKRVYGDAQAWHKIFEANRAIIRDPDLIHPGQRLTIPPA